MNVMSVKGFTCIFTEMNFPINYTIQVHYEEVFKTK